MWIPLLSATSHYIYRLSVFLLSVLHMFILPEDELSNCPKVFY